MSSKFQQSCNFPILKHWTLMVAVPKQMHLSDLFIEPHDRHDEFMNINFNLLIRGRSHWIRLTGLTRSWLFQEREREKRLRMGLRKVAWLASPWNIVWPLIKSHFTEMISGNLDDNRFWSGLSSDQPLLLESSNSIWPWNVAFSNLNQLIRITTAISRSVLLDPSPLPGQAARLSEAFYCPESQENSRINILLIDDLAIN